VLNLINKNKPVCFSSFTQFVNSSDWFAKSRRLESHFEYGFLYPFVITISLPTTTETPSVEIYSLYACRYATQVGSFPEVSESGIYEKRLHK
jgi:hypothetical protein